MLIPLLSHSQQPPVYDSTFNAQQYLRFDTTWSAESLAFLETLFPPFLIENGIELKEFIRSDEFQNVRSEFGDQKAIDAIYIRSMQLTKNNTGIALFLSMLSCFDHRYLRIDIPFFLLAIPLSDESEEEFTARLKNLPTKLFADTPNIKMGDRDKLQHFFGSAFITYIFESPDFADRLGFAIEQGEQSFIVGGTNDSRDVRTNRLGQQFALALMNNPFTYPSRFLKKVVTPKDSSQSIQNMEFDNGFDSCH